MTFNPETYTIFVRQEKHDGECYFVGRVAEFPNISAFEDSAEQTRAMVIDALEILKLLADQDGIAFPLPNQSFDDEYSDRVSLRMPKTLHARIAKKKLKRRN